MHKLIALMIVDTTIPERLTDRQSIKLIVEQLDEHCTMLSDDDVSEIVNEVMKSI
jgi:hypothetical protein